MVSVRPGKLCVTATAADGPSCPGRVVTARFLGETRELTIELQGERGRLQVTAHVDAAARFSAGDRVFVSVVP